MRTVARLQGIRLQQTRAIIDKISDMHRVGDLRFKINLSRMLYEDLMSLEVSQKKALFQRVCILVLNTLNYKLVDKILRYIHSKLNPYEACTLDMFISELLRLHDMRLNSYQEDEMLNLLRARMIVCSYRSWDTLHAFWRSQRKYALMLDKSNHALREENEHLANEARILTKENRLLRSENYTLKVYMNSNCAIYYY